MDPRIAGEETRQQGWNDKGAVVVHHAETDHAFDLALGEAADRLFVQRQDAPCVSEQSFARRAQIDVRLGPVEKVHAEAIFEAFDLHAHSRLRPVERGGSTREGAMVRHRDERLQ